VLVGLEGKARNIPPREFLLVHSSTKHSVASHLVSMTRLPAACNNQLILVMNPSDICDSIRPLDALDQIFGLDVAARSGSEGNLMP
jgi:hypothetical protein